MKIITASLNGPALDWAVAKCEGLTQAHQGALVLFYCGDWTPSTDWAKGGPIIEREGVALTLTKHTSMGPMYLWSCTIYTGATGKGAQAHHLSGPTPLVVAMRCYVASKLGDEVDVPEELL